MSAAPLPLIDKELLNDRQRRIAEPVDFLVTWAEQEISDRLDDIKRDFAEITLLSPSPSEAFLGRLSQKGSQISTIRNASLIESEILPLEPESQDLILSFFDMHRINDLPGWLIQLRRSLKKGGAFIGCYAGEQTLFQLRQSILAAEIAVMGGASPRVLPFTGKQQMAGLLQRAGFDLPVVDSETVTVLYRDLFQMMQDLRNMGETNAMSARYKKFTPPNVFIETSKIYAERFAEQDGRLPATFDIGFVIGWAG